MNINTTLILIKNSKTKQLEDKTAEISYLNFAANQAAVTYTSSNKTYKYNSSNIVVLKDPKIINTTDRIMLVEGFPIRSSSTVLDFGEYIKIIDENGRAEAHHKSKVSFEDSSLNQKHPKLVFDYLKQMSAHISVMEDGRTILAEHYEKITKISKESVLANYLSGASIKTRSISNTPIFPFGFNLSQKKAVITALENSISIIEGPPGTGKTQTILNIIANVVAKGKTVGVVSGNNSATSNVQEKLKKNGFGFITSLLGNLSNKAEFFQNNQGEVPDITDWSIEAEDIKGLNEQLDSTSKALDELLEKQNKIAKLKDELSKLEVEQKYFENNFKDDFIEASKFSLRRRWPSDFILEFIAHLDKVPEATIASKLKTRIYLLFKFGIYKYRFFYDNYEGINNSLKRDYYKSSIEERKKQINVLESKLENKSFKEVMETYADISAKLFKSSLHKRYSNKTRETIL